MKYIFLSLFFVNIQANCQNPGPRLVAMGSGGTAVQDIWSLQQNPAGVAGLKRPALAIAYEQHILISDISTQTALFVVPYRRSVLGLSFEKYGISDYSEQKIGLSYARRFGDSFRLAVALKYCQLNIDRYGSSKALSVEAGFQVHVTDKFVLASHIVNPNRSRYQDFSGSYLPVRLSFGASYRFSDRVVMLADLRKLLNNPLDVMTGIEYKLIRWFSLRGGISANPFKRYSGFGINYNKLQLDVAIASHPNLGYSPQISLGYEF